MPPIPYDRLYHLETPDLSPLKKPIVHDACQEELRALLPSDGDLAVLEAQMKKRIGFWYENPQEARKKKDWFEPVGDISEGGTVYPCFSLRFNRIRQLGNLRILYIMDGSTMILMHAFRENRHGAYRHAKDVVLNRLRKG